MPDQFRWIESAGGPLLLLADDLLGFWEGVNTPPSFRSVSAEFRWAAAGGATDYDRACDVKEYLGIIDVGPGSALVLGDEPLATTWIGAPAGASGMLVRCRFAEADEDIRRAIGPQMHEQKWNPGPRFHVDTNPLVLFDAAVPGPRIESGLIVSLAQGSYQIDTLDFRPHSELSLLLHRFRQE